MGIVVQMVTDEDMKAKEAEAEAKAAEETEEQDLNIAASVKRQASMLGSSRAAVNARESDVFDGSVGRAGHIAR